MDIKHLLRTSVDMDWVRVMTNALIFALLICVLIGLLVGGMEYAGMFLLIGFLVELPTALYLVHRCWKIFRWPEYYRQYQCTLSALNTPEFFSVSRAAAFWVVIEDEDGSKEVVSTNRIFFYGGLESPQLKDYVNRTVTIAYNPATGSVAVIG